MLVVPWLPTDRYRLLVRLHRQYRSPCARADIAQIFNFGLVLFATWAFRIHNWKKAPSTQKTPAAAQAEKGAAAGQGTLTGGQRTDEAATDGAAPAKNARETV